jgi:hypothetical protein
MSTLAILVVSWKVHRVEVREFVHNFRLERERSQQDKILNALPMRVLVVSKKQTQAIQIPDVDVTMHNESKYSMYETRGPRDEECAFRNIEHKAHVEFCNKPA